MEQPAQRLLTATVKL